MTLHSYTMRHGWWQKFRSQSRVKWIWRFFLCLVILSGLANVLSNDSPVACEYQGQTLYPMINPDLTVDVSQPGGGSLALRAERIDWHDLDLSNAWWAPIPYGSRARNSHSSISPIGQQKLKNGQILTLRNRHWFGTDQSGRDVLAGLLRGIRISLGIGVLATLIAGLIGFLIGSMAGYFGDDRLILPRYLKWTMIPSALVGIWYGFIRRKLELTEVDGWAWWLQFGIGIVWIAGIALAVTGIGWLIWKQGKRQKSAIRVDFFLSRIIEVLDSLPQLLLIITLGAVLARDIWTFIILIGLTGWSGVARMVRAETLRIRNSDYIAAARISLIPSGRILFRHVWPQIIPIMLVPLAFGVGNVIIAESSLSFLGIIEQSSSWGGMLSEAVHMRQLWWLPIFPGIAIFLTVLSVNILGESLRKAMRVE